MIGRFWKHLAMAVLCALVISGTVESASFTYSSQRKQIKAAVAVLTSSPTQAASYVNPFIFYVMDRRQDLKPSGWDFYNPLAPTHVTQAVLSRWPGVYTEGQPVTKDMGCYWELDVAGAPASEIAQFDVLILIGRSTTFRFTSDEREKLRKFVDNGGVLWIDNLGGASFAAGNDEFFIAALQFSGDTTSLPMNVPAPVRTHSLVNRPFLLSSADVNKLGTIGPSATTVRYVYGTGSGVPPDDKYFTSILLGGNKPTISAAQYGSGHIVVSAAGISQAITEFVGLRDNSIGYCGEAFLRAETEDLRFAYNVVNLISQHTTFQKNGRHSGYSPAEVGEHLRLPILWDFRTGSVAPTVSSPAILDDMVFYVDGDGWLHAFELTPTKDRDGDGNPDDGEADTAAAQYDRLWSRSVGPASSPTVAYVPLGGGAVVPVVFVTKRSGEVVWVDASTLNPAAPQQVPADFSPSKADFPVNEISAPTYADGVLYWSDGSGYLHSYSFFPPNQKWTHPHVSNPPASGWGYSPTVGYFYDRVSGATEQVVYVAKHGLNPIGQGDVACYPVRVFNEMLRQESASAGGYKYTTRSARNTPIVSGGILRLYYFDNTGSRVDIPVPSAQALVNSDGTPTPVWGCFWIADTVPAVTNGWPIYTDYELEYSSNPSIMPRQKISIARNKSGMDYSGIICAPAAGRNDIIYFSTENGSVYASHENARSTLPVTIDWRWHFGDAAAAAALGGSATPVGSPAVSGDMVYVAANIAGGSGLILAFKADPVFSINLGEPIKPGTFVRVKQVDSLNPADPPFVISSGVADDPNVRSVTFFVDYEAGKLTFVNFRKGSDLSASQDLIIEYTPLIASEPVTVTRLAFAPLPGDKWNNLVWFIPVPYEITSSPMAMGDVLYVGCRDGTLVSLNVTEIGKGRTGPAEMIDWNQALSQGMAWPDNVLGSGAIYASAAGSHGMLAVATADGLAVQHNPVSLVADGNRLVEIDAGGSATWSCDSTSELAGTAVIDSGNNVGSSVHGSVRVPFNRPAVARRAPAGGIVVVDTGNNRVVHIDSGGNVLRHGQITTFIDTGSPYIERDRNRPNPRYPNDPILPAGSPLTLNRPRDVSMWTTWEPEDPSDPTGPAHPAYHYLVADTGNYRVLEIVARYDPVSQTYRNELWWASKTLAQGKRYEYLSVRYIYDPTTNGDALVCAVAGGVKDGGVAIPGALVKIARIGTANETYTVHTGLPLDSLAPDRVLVSPTFFSRRYRNNTDYIDVVLDARGIHVVDSSGGTSTVRPAFRAQDYFYTRTDGSTLSLPFAPSYAQILDNGSVLVTNKAMTATGDFTGEIFEIDRNGVIGWRSWNMNPDLSNTHGLRQPSSAERQSF